MDRPPSKLDKTKENELLSEPFIAKKLSDDPNNPVQISMLLTEIDRRRLKTMAIEENLSLQRLAHLAWNNFLESQGLPRLTPVPKERPKKGT